MGYLLLKNSSLPIKFAVRTENLLQCNQAPLLPLNLDARSDYSPTFSQPTLSRKRLLKLSIFLGLGAQLKSFPTSNLSNSQKQCNLSMIMAFTLSMLLTLPTIWNLRTLMNLFPPLSLTSLQILCIVSLLCSLVLSFCFYVTNCINCIVRNFIANSNKPSPLQLLCTFLQFPQPILHMCTTNQPAWVWSTYHCNNFSRKTNPQRRGEISAETFLLNLATPRSKRIFSILLN